MVNNFFQDMVKTKREMKHEQEKTHRVPVKRVAREKAPEPEIGEEDDDLETFEDKLAAVNAHAPTRNKKKKSGASRSIWTVAFISVVFLFFALSFLFSGATITVDPRIKDIVLNRDFLAMKDSATDDLSFELIALSGEESKAVLGGEKRTVSERAVGTVVIYNSFSSSSQRLDIDTRLGGSNGKLYKTKTAVSVPGMSGNTPGSMEVAVYANEPGQSYNSDPLDFTIVGLKGTPKYEKFTVRSKGSISGGMSGEVSVVSPEERALASTELNERLKANLLQKAEGTIPPGFILFKDAAFLDIEKENIGDIDTNGLVSFSIQGTLYGFLFNEKKLTQKIAEYSVEGYDGSEVYVPNIRELKFSIANQDITMFRDVKSLMFNLSGSSKIVWKVDEKKLILDLVGKKKKDFNSILSTYLNVVSAEVTFRPFWKRSFPEKEKNIKLLVNYK